MMRLSPYYWFTVGLLTAAACACPPAANAELAKSAVMENNVGYVRIGQTDKNLPQEIQSAISSLEQTNKIAGIVLDLRFAGGSDSGSVKSTEAVLTGEKLPLAILVNAQTSGDAASLADDLREANTGLIFGSAATGNLRPDILVSIGTNDERDLLKNPYGVMTIMNTNSPAGTNLLPFVDVDHTSEADLVRAKIKDGDQDETTAQPAPPRPFIRDPVLAHGVDFIKGLAALDLNKG